MRSAQANQPTGSGSDSGHVGAEEVALFVVAFNFSPHVVTKATYREKKVLRSFIVHRISIV
jgi:hypothetical protein